LIRAVTTIIPQKWYHDNLAAHQILPYNSDYINHFPQEAYMRRMLGFSIGAVLGGLIGAGLALLFAPASGKDLRNQINERARSFSSDIRQAANTKRIELQDRLEELRAPKA
jgi:hypothetical protein